MPRALQILAARSRFSGSADRRRYWCISRSSAAGVERQTEALRGEAQAGAVSSPERPAAPAHRNEARVFDLLVAPQQRQRARRGRGTAARPAARRCRRRTACRRRRTARRAAALRAFHRAESTRLPCLNWRRRAASIADRARSNRTAGSLQLVDVARPARLQQPRQRAVRQHAAAGLAARAVVRLVVGIDDALHRRAAHGAGLAVAAVHRHVVAERRHLLPESRAGLGAQPVGPLGRAPPASRRTGAASARASSDLRQRQRRQPGAMQDLVRVRVADAARACAGRSARA